MKLSLSWFGAKPWRKSLFFALAVLACLLAAAWYLKLPALAWYWANSLRQEQVWRQQSLWLPDYQASIDAQPIEGVSLNASGLTYDDRTQTLYLAVNNPAEIVELTTEGRLLRRIQVRGVEDLEGLTHIQDDQFVLIDERRQRLYRISIPPETTQVDMTNAPWMELGILLNGNLGFEGVSWNSHLGLLFVAKEKSPLRIFSIKGFLPNVQANNPLNLEIREWQLKVDPRRFLRDLSSLSLHDRTGHLLVLSDESKMLAEYSKAGDLVSMAPLWRGWHGLARAIPQAEGVTVDPQGTLYIVSEPNLFYRFEKRR
ncbi:MAG: SdiA-regulated domain-containing protein [Zoogloeaceae bacterium]|nr:SdiA-regulated domain-containing protein [Zoogloeaceae bacterium]